MCTINVVNATQMEISPEMSSSSVSPFATSDSILFKVQSRPNEELLATVPTGYPTGQPTSTPTKRRSSSGGGKLLLRPSGQPSAQPTSSKSSQTCDCNAYCKELKPSSSNTCDFDHDPFAPFPPIACNSIANCYSSCCQESGTCPTPSCYTSLGYGVNGDFACNTSTCKKAISCVPTISSCNPAKENCLGLVSCKDGKNWCKDGAGYYYQTGQDCIVAGSPPQFNVCEGTSSATSVLLSCLDCSCASQ